MAYSHVKRSFFGMCSFFSFLFVLGEMRNHTRKYSEMSVSE